MASTHTPKPQQDSASLLGEGGMSVPVQTAEETPVQAEEITNQVASPDEGVMVIFNNQIYRLEPQKLQHFMKELADVQAARAHTEGGDIMAALIDLEGTEDSREGEQGGRAARLEDLMEGTESDYTEDLDATLHKRTSCESSIG